MGTVVAFPVESSPSGADGNGPAPEEAFFFPLPDGNPDSDPRVIADRLVKDTPRFSHLALGEALITFLMRAEPKVKAGKRTLGYIALPRFQGSMGDVALWLLVLACQRNLPDYLMVLDAQFWDAATPFQREALVFHELCHTVHATDKEGELKFTDSGRPVFDLQAHDLEEFNDVVAKYGAWLPDVAKFAAALAEGGVV